MKPNPFYKNVSGIYGIRNVINNKLYIGKTHCMYSRCHQYVYDLSNRNIGHINDYLFNAIRKVGVENFEFFGLEFCNPDDLSTRELHWITYYKTTERNYGYNLRMDSSGGMIPHDETRTKISDNLRRQWAQGDRSGHSQKMKNKWASDPKRKSDQGKLFSNLKTKYEYEVHHPDGTTEQCLFQRLKELGLEGCMSSFHRTKQNDIILRGYRIVRYSKGEHGQTSQKP